MFLPPSEWLILFKFLLHWEVFEILSESHFFARNVMIHPLTSLASIASYSSGPWIYYDLPPGLVSLTRRAFAHAGCCLGLPCRRICTLGDRSHSFQLNLIFGRPYRFNLYGEIFLAKHQDNLTATRKSITFELLMY